MSFTIKFELIHLSVTVKILSILRQFDDGAHAFEVISRK